MKEARRVVYEVTIAHINMPSLMDYTFFRERDGDALRAADYLNGHRTLTQRDRKDIAYARRHFTGV